MVIAKSRGIQDGVDGLIGPIAGKRQVHHLGLALADLLTLGRGAIT